MSSSLLPIIQDNAEYDLENIIPDILSNEVESKYFHISWNAYHVRAISTLLLQCNVSEFYLDLQRSASSYLFYLQKVVVESEKKTSFSLGFFDAIACEDWETARLISESSRQTHNSDVEYIDDFLFVFFLMKYFLLDTSAVELENILMDLQVNVSEDTACRLAICKSFMECDSDLFNEAICELIAQYDESINERYQNGLVPEEKWIIESSVFVEGLALLKLAKKAGLLIKDSEYKLIPSILFTADVPSYTRDSWLHLD